MSVHGRTISWQTVRRAGVLASAVVAWSAGTASAAPVRQPSIMVEVGARTDVAALAARHDASVLRRFPQIGWVELGLRGGHRTTARAAAAAAGALGRDAAVRDVAYQRPADDFGWDFVPRDPLFSRGLQFNDGAAIGWHFVKPNFPVAWDRTTGNTGIKVAVIDSEFDTDNPDLKEKLVDRHNVASGTAQYHTGDVKAKPGDTFHGSHTSGLVGARTDNGLGVAGACFDCGIMALKVGSDAAGTFVSARFLGDVTEGLLHAADRGVSVVNMSLGGTRPYAPLQDAVNYAHARGVVLVGSAGNSQQNNPGVPNYPAAFDHVIAVAATDNGDAIADFSTNGPFVDVSAPGKDVLSTTDGGEQGAVTIDPQGGPQAPLSIKSGTSMAAPIVAGLAALMRTARPDLTPDEIESIMKSTARDLGAVGPDQVYGAGRVDAGAAIATAQSYVRPVPPPPPPPPPPPAPLAPPADTVGPTVGLKGGLSLSRRKLGFTVVCPAGEVACTGTVIVSARKLGATSAAVSLPLGRRVYTAKGGQARRITISLSRKARSRLRRWNRAQFTVTVKATDSLGNTQITRNRRTLRPKRILV